MKPDDKPTYSKRQEVERNETDDGDKAMATLLVKVVGFVLCIGLLVIGILALFHIH